MFVRVLLITKQIASLGSVVDINQQLNHINLYFELQLRVVVIRL